MLRTLQAGDGEPLLLLHGFGLTPMTYQGTVDRLAERYRVVAPWLRLNAPWTFDGLVAAALETLDAARVDDALVVGHSFGGAVALALAATSPKRVSALVLADALGGTPGRATLTRLALRGRNIRYATLSATRDFVGYAVRDPRGLATSALWAYGADLWPLCDELTKACVPRSVLWAADDGLLPVGLGRALAERLRASIIEVDDVDHDWVYRHPDVFGAALPEAVEAARSAVDATRPDSAAR